MSVMTEQFVRKNLKLSLEFDKYVIEHPKAYKSIPKGAYVVITMVDDPDFSKQSRSLIRNPQQKKVIEAQKTPSGWKIRPLQTSAA